MRLSEASRVLEFGYGNLNYRRGIFSVGTEVIVRRLFFFVFLIGVLRVLGWRVFYIREFVF